MTNDVSDVSLSIPTVATLFVAGLSLGAVYAFNYARLGRSSGDDASVPSSEKSRGDTRHHHHTHAACQSGRTSPDGPREGKKSNEGVSLGMSGTHKGRKKRKKTEGVLGASEGEGKVRVGSEAAGAGDSQERVAAVDLSLGIVPGDFELAGADVGSRREGSPAGTVSRPGTSVETQTKKKKRKTRKQKQKQDQGKEAGGVVDVARTAVRGPCSEDNSTDASVSLLPGDVLPGSSRGIGKEHIVPPSQPRPQFRENRPSLSVDTDSSWTHVDQRRPKTSKSAGGQARERASAANVTSSDLASTASDSPVAERTDNVTADMRSARADLAQRTLAERLAPRPGKAGVDDMLERPEFPTRARVMRVQPRADETPVPGFSWEDYGDVVEDSALVHDADEEDEGEWGVVKSRYRTLSPPTTTASASASTSQAPAASTTMTKRQRQNVRKRELAKAVKADVEAARLQGLANHKRELERLRVIEQSRQGGGKRPSGGMQPTVDDRGKLVWE